MSRFATIVAFILTAAPCGSATGQRSRAVPHDVLARAVAAMGGEQALRGVRGVTTEFYGATFALGQEETPESPPRAGLVQGRITLDYAGNRKVGAIEARPPSGAVNRLRRITAGGITLRLLKGRITVVLKNENRTAVEIRRRQIDILVAVQIRRAQCP